MVVFNNIDEMVFFGGPLCRHTTGGGRSFWSIADRIGGGKGKKIHLTDHTYIEPGEENGNPEHIGCPKRAGRKRVLGGDFLIIGVRATSSTLEEAQDVVLRIVVTPEADIKKVIGIVRQRLGLAV